MFKLTNSKFKLTNSHTLPIGGGSSNAYPKEFGSEGHREVEIKGF